MSQKDPNSHRNQLHRVIRADVPFLAVKGKQYGYSCRDGAAAMYEFGQPVISIPSLKSCTYEPCQNVEEPGGDKFKRCAFCLTTYCSQQCMASDWRHGEHKAFCKSRGAYQSQLDRFSMEDVPGDLGIMLSDKYLDFWDRWIQSELMQKVLKHCGLTVAEVRPKSLESKPEKPVQPAATMSDVPKPSDGKPSSGGSASVAPADKKPNIDEAEGDQEEDGEDDEGDDFDQEAEAEKVREETHAKAAKGAAGHKCEQCKEPAVDPVCMLFESELFYFCKAHHPKKHLCA